MGKQELVDVVNRITEMEKILTPMGGDFMPSLKTINRKPEFLKWKEELKFQLQKLKNEPIINETLELLDTGFKSSLNDEKDFVKLQGKLETISLHIDEFFVEKEEKMQMNESQKLKKGTIVKTAFDEYALIEQVGLGGNGRVFSAESSDGEKVAIKFLERTTSSEKLKRFKNEINFCEQHKHKNVVSILDRGYVFLDDKDYVFYVMPLYKETLRKKIKEGIPQEKVIDIFVGILEGLKFAHSHKAIHRDIKPENILFSDGSFEPIICDFGIAHFAEEDLITVVETKATDRMANFQYSAPEQRKRGGNICPQTDIYSLALILNEIFTGEIPQAAGHKRIADVSAEHKYLDELFDLLFKQEPEERLYPEDKILSEMKLLANEYKREQEKFKLQNVIDETITPEDFESKIINVEYINRELIFEFDKTLPNEWIRIIRAGDYDHSSVMGYDPKCLVAEDSNKLLMPLRNTATENTIKSIMTYIKQWVTMTNAKYSAMVKRKTLEEQQRKETQRLAEIKRIEQESKFNNTINSIFADLY